MGTRKLRAELFQTMNDFQDGKITEEEALKASDEASEKLKVIKKDMLNKLVVTEAEVVKNNIELTEEEVKLAQAIKAKLRKTAETIVEIGEELTCAIENKPKGFKSMFYTEVGISDRSAQRYMQIAKHVKIQELKSSDQLEGKTMTDLLSIMSPNQQESSKTINVSEVANNFYNRYKNNPVELKKIMQELQTLIDSSVQK